MNQHGFTHLVVLSVIAVIAMSMIGVMAYFRMQANELAADENTNTVVNNTNSTSNTNSVADNTEGWKTYTNDVYSIKYPSDWVAGDEQVNAGGVIRVASFRPETVHEDFIWGIWEYDTTQTIDALAAQMGKQFSDRSETRTSITVDGVPATQVTVTTQQYPDWVSTNVYIPTAQGLIAISDGAVAHFPFSAFLSSFQFVVTTQSGSTTVSADDTWNTYTNYDLGFSINIPKQAWVGEGGCHWATNSYRPDNAEVPIATFEETNGVYVAQAYYYLLSGETVQNDIHYFSKCTKTDNSISHLSQNSQNFHFVVATVSSEAELNSFIQQHYGGSDCSLESKSESVIQPGTFDVTVHSGGPGSNCWINYGTKLKYYPSGQTVVSWNTGQSISFFSANPEVAANVSSFYDNDISDSFRFIEQ